LVQNSNGSCRRNSHHLHIAVVGEEMSDVVLTDQPNGFWAKIGAAPSGDALALRIARSILLPGSIGAEIALTRSQPSEARSTGLNALGVGWAEYPADVARFLGIARRLGVEGQRTNLIRNPRCEGAIGATPPTHWELVLPAGVTAAWTRTTRNGIEGVDIELSGTSTNALQFVINFDITRPVAASGQTWASSFFFQELVGVAGVTASEILVLGETAGGAFVEGTSSNFFASRSTLQRRSISFSMANANTTRAAGLYRTNTIASGTNLTGYRIFLGWPQLEQGAFASSPILPPVGAPAASTRGADLVTATLASLGIGANGACTVLGTFMLPQPTPSGFFPSMFTVQGATSENSYGVFQDATGGVLYIIRRTAGVNAVVPVGAVTAGTQFRVGMTVSGAGGASVSLNGGAPVSITGGPTSGMSIFRIGSDYGGVSQMFGEIGLASVLPFSVSDANLQQLVARL
jgi:hypothetical protein